MRARRPIHVAFGGLPHTYDAEFEKFGGSIPVEFLRALGVSESDLSPRQVTGAAVGLLQITPGLLKDYNTQHGTNYDRASLFDVETNIKIAVWELEMIVSQYAKNHPHTLVGEWGDPRWVALVVQGWNKGWSQGGGVQRIAAKLEAAGIPREQVTVDAVQEVAELAHMHTAIADANGPPYARKVARLFAKERAARAALVAVKGDPVEHGAHLAGISPGNVAALFVLVPILGWIGQYLWRHISRAAA